MFRSSILHKLIVSLTLMPFRQLWSVYRHFRLSQCCPQHEFCALGPWMSYTSAYENNQATHTILYLLVFSPEVICNHAVPAFIYLRSTVELWHPTSNPPACPLVYRALSMRLEGGRCLISSLECGPLGAYLPSDSHCFSQIRVAVPILIWTFLPSPSSAGRVQGSPLS
jgi:hypothetical protein